mmetsp:Transcript_10466/g.17966  ORF Transcript_10466/g.17966 Transcript_10466/m.17966 type:complete len:242 (+) Transcript_10466:1521-2246(+)
MEGSHLRQFLNPSSRINMQQGLQRLWLNLETCSVNLRRHNTDGGWHAIDRGVGASLGNPFEHAGIITKTWPHKLAFLVLAEPVDVEDLGRLLAKALTHLEPVVLHVVTHVISAEWKHGIRVKSKLALFTFCGSRLFRRTHAAHEDTMIPVKGLDNQRHSRSTSATKQNGIDGHTVWVVKLVRNHRAVLRPGSVARIRVRSEATAARLPCLLLPVLGNLWRGIRETLPPDITILSQGAVGEQ